MPILRNEYNFRAKGGTELSIAELEARLKPELLEQVNIIPGRFRGLPNKKPAIFWIHDTADDPEMRQLAYGGWKHFVKLVFVSHWQRQKFVDMHGIPWSKTAVLPNAIVFDDPPNISLDWSGKTPVRFIYHTTPHRGLNVLYAGFNYVAQKSGIPMHLDVYSSFDIYGWGPAADKPYEALFDEIRNNPNCTYHGAKSNEEIRAALKQTHFFVYPCIWPETGCRALMEAMGEGVACAVSDFAVMPETSSGINYLFPYNEDYSIMAQTTANTIEQMMQTLGEGKDHSRIRNWIANSSRRLYNWNERGQHWNELLEEVLRDQNSK